MRDVLKLLQCPDRMLAHIFFRLLAVLGGLLVTPVASLPDIYKYITR